MFYYIIKYVLLKYIFLLQKKKNHQWK